MAKNMVSQQAMEMMKVHRRIKRWHTVVTVLACIVVFCTTYALILPAITKEKETYCGYEEHKEHTDIDGCYKYEKICPYGESTDKVGDVVLICGEDVVSDEQSLISEEEETHVHTDACYHTHTEECFEKQLICQKELHEHTLACYSNPEADVESKSYWESTMDGVKHTGIWADDLVAIAESQLGYKESKDNYSVMEDGETIKGYTRYGDWYGDTYGDWSAMFVSFCLNYAGIAEEYVPYEESCSGLKQALQKKELYRTTSEYTPVKGDLAFFDNDECPDNNPDKVGIILEFDQQTGELTTVEGDSDNRIKINHYQWNTFPLLGYGVLPKNPNIEKNVEPDSTSETDIGEDTIDATDTTVTTDTCSCYDKDGNKLCTEDCECQCHPVAEPDYPMEDVGVGNMMLAAANNGSLGLNLTRVSASPEGFTNETYTNLFDNTVETKYCVNSPNSSKIEVIFKTDSAKTAGSYSLTTANDTAAYGRLPNGWTLYGSSDQSSWATLDTVTSPGMEAVNFKEYTYTIEHPGSYQYYKIVFDVPSGNVIQFSELNLFEETVVKPSDGGKTVIVNMAWSDGTSAHKGDNIRVRLYQDGTATALTATLNSSNNWSHSFTNLSENSNYSIEYSTVPGYYYKESSESTGTTWEKSTSLVSGNTYVLVYSNSLVVQNSSGDILSEGSVTVSGDRITGVTDAMQWDYNNSTLKNVNTDRYLQLTYSNGGYSWHTSTSGTTISYNNRKISSVANDRTRYLMNYNTATNSSNGTTYTLYQKVKATPSTTFTIVGNKQKIINPAEGDTPQFEHNKTIDYLNDGDINPDTSLSGEDYYRLYLDMTGKQEPIDLLIVVDGSGSMNKTDMEGSMRRDDAITKFLNGSTTSTNSNGFIQYFLGLNSDNKVSVIQFYGNTNEYGRGRGMISTSYPGASTDSRILQDWTGTRTFVSCRNQNNNGTNYEAGLKLATDQFSKVSGDGRRKIMIFMSDGVPTFFLVDQNDVGTYPAPSLTNANIGQRWGNGIYSDTNNYPYCKEPSKTAFNDFISSNPGVTVFTIGVSNDISATSQDESQSPEVLEYMASRGNGQFFSVSSSMTELKLKLESIFYPKGVTITDELSQYVRYYSDQPDVKVTMTNLLTGEETVLWQNGTNQGEKDDNGNNIFDRVVYIPDDTADAPTGSTGTVQAIFGDNYCFSPSYRYTLSFNVKTTTTAYDEYRSNNKSYGGVTGDPSTDYGNNATSSGKPGFHSNTKAYVEYSITNIYYSELYTHPVVQVQYSEYELPSTGGSGTYWYSIGGLLIITGVIFYGCKLKCNLERRHE